MKDLVKKLRNAAAICRRSGMVNVAATCGEAADYIELLDADLAGVGVISGKDAERLEEAMQRNSAAARAPCRPSDLPSGEHDWHHGQCGRCGSVQRTASAPEGTP